MKKIKWVISEFLSLEGSLFTYSLSYCFLLALLPSLSIGIMLFQNSVLDIEDLLGLAYQFLPKDLIQPFVEYILDKDYNTAISLTISLIISCYVASKGLYSFMLISAKHESFETYKTLIRIKSVILFFILVSGVIAIALITHLLHLEIMITFGVGLVIILYLFFRMLSFKKRAITFGLVGSIFTSISIVLLGQLFFFIIFRFTSYKNVYGPLSSVVILLLSVYIIACVIYIGYCLNFAYTKDPQKDQYKYLCIYRFGERIIDRFKVLIKKITNH